MAKKINSSQVVALKSTGQVISESLGTHGSLVARRLSNTTCWRYQYRHDGKLKRYTFGYFSKDGDSSGSDTASEYTLVGARDRASELAKLQASVGDLSEHFKEQQVSANEIRREAQQARSTRQQETRDYSLGNLCKAYWSHLETDRKASARDVRNGLRLWVIERHPELSNRKASEVSTEDVLTILRAIIKAGHTTTTNRVRSYLSAAYTFGLGSTTDPLASSRANGFRLTSNPVAPVKRVASFEKAGERVLTSDELGELLRRLEASNTKASKAVTLSLRLGGQRIKQLLAATRSDYDTEADTLTLKDSKGRRTHARLHVLPVVPSLTPMITHALENPHPRRAGLYHGLTMETVSKQVREISKQMEKKGGKPFGWRDLRRTCETMLAKMGISKDLRAQIQSHGLSGVQDRHYDKHRYVEEKRAVLESWNTKLDGFIDGKPSATNVLPMVQSK